MKVYAHRGYSGKYPENTMLAFQQAALTGCDGIELDVQLAKDGTVVIIHDEAIDRTTDGTGFIKDLTYEELKQFNAGELYKEQYGFCPIPSFEEYCIWAKDQNLITNIELKSGSYYYQDLEEKTLELIRRYNLGKKVFFSSFNHVSLLHLKQLAPDLECGALLGHAGIGNAGYYCSKFGFEYYHPGFKGLTEEAVKSCIKYGIKVNVWTINDMKALETINKWGCNGVITNYPEECKSWLDKNKYI